MTKIGKTTATLAVWLSCICCFNTLHAVPPAGSKWEPIQELTDEFDGDELDSKKWHDHNPDWTGRYPGYFSKRNVSVEDGKVHLVARVESLKDLPNGYHTFTTAAVKSKELVQYGYFEIKCKPMKSKASSAFWFYRTEENEWTEIDVFELCGVGQWQKTYNMNAHVFPRGKQKKHLAKHGEWNAPFAVADDYHVYALEWDKDFIKWYVDGKVVRELKNTHWHQALHMNFDSETMPEWFGLPDKKNLPSTFSIEYVRSWKKTNTAEPEDSGDKK